MTKIANVLPRYQPSIDRMRVSNKDKDPNYHYRTALPRTERLQFLESIGYEIVLKKDPKTGKDVPYQVGTSILMRCKKEDFEKREKARVTIAQARVDAPRKRVVEQGARLGVEVIDETRTMQGPLEAAGDE